MATWCWSLSALLASQHLSAIRHPVGYSEPSQFSACPSPSRALPAPQWSPIRIFPNYTYYYMIPLSRILQGYSATKFLMSSSFCDKWHIPALSACYTRRSSIAPNSCSRCGMSPTVWGRRGHRHRHFPDHSVGTTQQRTSWFYVTSGMPEGYNVAKNHMHVSLRLRLDF